jgi:Putative peptidoglycan binding domain
VKLIGDQKVRLSITCTCCDGVGRKKDNCMKFITNLLAGLLLTGVLALAPANSFARGGGGGGGHFGGGGSHMGAFRGGSGSGRSGAMAHGFHGSIAQGDRGDGAWRHDGGFSHHWYSGSYGYFSPFDYGLDDYTGTYYDDGDSLDVQPPANDGAPDESTSLVMSVQKELARLGYYHGPIDGVAGSETERAVRWFQAIDHLPVTGQIDSATRQALRIA